MGRYSETSDTLKKTVNQMMYLCDSPKKVSEEELLCGIFNVLTEIALSLAVLADTRRDC